MQIRSRGALLRIHLASWQPTVDTTCVVGQQGTSLNIVNEFSKIKHIHTTYELEANAMKVLDTFQWSYLLDFWIFPGSGLCVSLYYINTSCSMLLWIEASSSPSILNMITRPGWEYLQYIYSISTVYLATRGEVMGPDTRLLLPSLAAQIDSPCIML